MTRFLGAASAFAFLAAIGVAGAQQAQQQSPQAQQPQTQTGTPEQGERPCPPGLPCQPAQSAEGQGTIPQQQPAGTTGSGAAAPSGVQPGETALQAQPPKQSQ